MSKEYEKLQREYQSALAKSKAGDKGAQKDKAKLGMEIRQCERASARAGKPLDAVIELGGRVTVKVGDCPSKKSLQEEYVRRFDDKRHVEFKNGKNQVEYQGPLATYHRKRLGI